MEEKKSWPFEIVGLALIAGASVIAWIVFGSYKVVAGIWTGGLMGIINFKWLGSIIRGVFSEGNKVGYTIRYLLKFIFVIASSALLIFSKIADPLGFITGFTLIVITVSLKGADLTNRS